MNEPLLSSQSFAEYELLTYPGYFRLVAKEGRRLVQTFEMVSLEPTHEQLQSQSIDMLLAIYRDKVAANPNAEPEACAGWALEAIDPRHAPYTEKQKTALVTLDKQARGGDA